MNEAIAWGVLPGDGLPLWRCSSRLQAERMVAWLQEQRPESTPQAVPLVDGRNSLPTLTDAEREAIEGMAAYFDTRGNITLQAWGSLLRVLLMRWQ